MSVDDLLVFDTGPLRHFALAGWLGVLKAVVGNRTAIVPDVVEEELKRQAAVNDLLRPVLDANWIGRRAIETDDEIERFALFSARLVRGSFNVGEAGVLAVAASLHGTAVIDDEEGRKAAADHDVALKPTLALLCEAIRDGLLTVELVGELANDLLFTEYRLPFDPGGFERWAQSRGQLP